MYYREFVQLRVSWYRVVPRSSCFTMGTLTQCVSTNDILTFKFVKFWNSFFLVFIKVWNIIIIMCVCNVIPFIYWFFYTYSFSNVSCRLLTLRSMQKITRAHPILSASFYNSLFPCRVSVSSSITFGFSYFEFKIRLIRLGFSFQKQKLLYSNSQSTDSQSGFINITPKR